MESIDHLIFEMSKKLAEIEIEKIKQGNLQQEKIKQAQQNGEEK